MPSALDLLMPYHQASYCNCALLRCWAPDTVALLPAGSLRLGVIFPNGTLLPFNFAAGQAVVIPAGEHQGGIQQVFTDSVTEL